MDQPGRATKLESACAVPTQWFSPRCRCSIVRHITVFGIDSLGAGTMADTGELQPGMLVGGCRIVKLIGRGGMGEVYLAEHQVLRKSVAIKTVRTNLPDPQLARERFLKEARLAARVEHPNVITIHDAGEMNGLLYIVMRFVKGQDLSQVLKAATAPLDWRLVMTWMRDAAAGLEEVHAQGLIHRDIKPHNLMLTASGRILVMDFGLVREDDPDASVTSGIIGSPAYMSPEQCRSERLDHRTDIYSLGATAYNLLSGSPPFLERSVHLIIMKLAQNSVAARLDRVRPDIPAGVAELVARTMAPVREQRIPDARTLAEEIDQLLLSATLAGSAPVGVEIVSTPRNLAVGGSQAHFAGSKAGDVKTLKAHGIDIGFSWCPAGRFTMGTPGTTGDESPVEVELTRGFWMGQTPVTQRLYEAVSHAKPSKFSGPQRPVEQVTWTEAVEFCSDLQAWLARQELLPDGWRLALPTEAQWEYAARAGTRTTWFFGDSDTDLARYAWFDANSKNETHDVATKRPNPWGLYDVYGNVWEWCADRYGEKLLSGRDPTGYPRAANRVYRGGCWLYSSVYCRSAVRGRLLSVFRLGILGFRPALVPVESSEHK